MKKLRYVTLTGADDFISPYELYKISQKYPNVEWGILIGSKEGVSRFPTRDWINELEDFYYNIYSNKGMNLSLHICGKHLENLVNGKEINKFFQMEIFKRCQLNFHGEALHQDAISNINKVFSVIKWNPEVIFQLNGVNNYAMQEFDYAMQEFDACERSGLYDSSHGAGILPNYWQANKTNYSIGYAGGLGPDNIKEQLPLIEEAAGESYWIDMETKLFTDGKFDLDKCKSVLEQVYGVTK